MYDVNFLDSVMLDETFSSKQQSVKALFIYLFYFFYFYIESIQKIIFWFRRHSVEAVWYEEKMGILQDLQAMFCLLIFPFSQFFWCSHLIGFLLVYHLLFLADNFWP